MEKLWFAACVLVLSAAASAELRENRSYMPEEEKPWEEAAVVLPDYPDLQRGEWFELYVNSPTAIKFGCSCLCSRPPTAACAMCWQYSRRAGSRI